MTRRPELPGVARLFDRATTAWLTVGGFALALGLTSYTRIDPDLWGHVRFGLDMLETRHLPAVDPYSFTQDRSWINHEWLSELLMGLAWLWGKAPGLTALKAMVVTAAMVMVWRASRGMDPVARLCGLAVAIIGVGPIALTVRPQLWTLLFLGVLVQGLAQRTPRPWLAFPVMFLLWANLHGGWIVGLAVLGVWTAGRVITDRPGAPAYVIALIASIAATLVTPYGWRLWEFLAQTVRLERDITEWQPAWTQWPALGIWSVGLAATLAAMARPRRDRWPAAAVLLLLAGLSLRVVRIEPLFMMAAAILLPAVWRDRWPAPARRAVFRPAREPVVAAALCVVMIAIAVLVGRRSTACITVDASWEPDRAAEGWLAHAEPGRLVTRFEWGEYAIWHFGPRLRVSMDGRRETIYSDQQLQIYRAILTGEPAGLDALAEWRAEYAWLPATSRTTKEWLQRGGYRIDFGGTDSFIAVRGDLPSLQPPATGLPRSVCFPG
jgi:hypothetical protein